MTAEHVWPRWLKATTKHRRSSFQVGVSDDLMNVREWTAAPFEHTARILCGPCNHRLGDLEQAVKPTVLRLLKGAATSVEPAEQVLLSRWLYKTGLMVASVNPHAASQLPANHYAGLRDSLDPPPASVVWIGRLEERLSEAAMRIQRFEWFDRELAEPLPAEGYFLVIGIGELAAIVGVADDRQSPQSRDMTSAFTLGGLGIGRLLRIWPASAHYGHRWPPPSSIPASELERMATAFAEWANQQQAARSVAP